MIVLANQLRQFDLFLDQRSIIVAGAFASLSPLSSAFLLRIARIILFFFQLLIPNTLDLTFLLLVARVIDADHAAHDTCPTEVVHCQIATSLVLIFQETESATLAGILVADQIDVDRISVLAEDRKNVSFAKFKR
jgi:hypothetical protein